MTQPTNKPALVPANTINKMAGHYDAKELRPYTGRPGAMDAYKLPSKMGSSLVWRKS